MNPAFGDAILRLSRNVNDALSVVNRKVDSTWTEVVVEEGESIRVDREKFCELDEAVRTHLMMRALSHVKETRKALNEYMLMMR